MIWHSDGEFGSPEASRGIKNFSLNCLSSRFVSSLEDALCKVSCTHPSRAWNEEAETNITKPIFAISAPNLVCADYRAEAPSARLVWHQFTDRRVKCDISPWRSFCIKTSSGRKFSFHSVLPSPETGDRKEDAGRRAMPVHVKKTNSNADLTSHKRTHFWTVSWTCVGRRGFPQIFGLFQRWKHVWELRAPRNRNDANKCSQVSSPEIITRWWFHTISTAEKPLCVCMLKERDSPYSAGVKNTPCVHINTLISVLSPGEERGFCRSATMTPLWLVLPHATDESDWRKSTVSLARCLCVAHFCLENVDRARCAASVGSSLAHLVVWAQSSWKGPKHTHTFMQASQNTHTQIVCWKKQTHCSHCCGKFGFKVPVYTVTYLKSSVEIWINSVCVHSIEASGLWWVFPTVVCQFPRKAALC